MKIREDKLEELEKMGFKKTIEKMFYIQLLMNYLEMLLLFGKTEK